MNPKNLEKTIFLKKDFRIAVFCKAYYKAGSLAGIGKEMGYRARPGLNGVARDMLLGRRGIGKERLLLLLKFTNISKNELEQNIIPKEESIELDNWMFIYEEYLKNKKGV